jgi:hypothetical protein
MKTAFLILVICSTALCFSGCDKDKPVIQDGVYTGTFTVSYHSGQQTGQTTLELSKGAFSCSGNANRFPAGGSGTYLVEHDKIIFSDTNFWTAEFDWNLILSGHYDYSFDGKRLTLSTTINGVATYKYELEKK